MGGNERAAQAGQHPCMALHRAQSAAVGRALIETFAQLRAAHRIGPRTASRHNDDLARPRAGDGIEPRWQLRRVVQAAPELYDPDAHLFARWNISTASAA